MEVDSLVISLGLDVEKVRQGVMQVDGFLKQLGQHIGVFMQEFQRGFTEAANAITQASTAATQQANAAAEAAREAGQRFQEAGEHGGNGMKNLADKTRKAGAAARQTGSEMQTLGHKWGSFLGGMAARFAAPLAGALSAGAVVGSYMRDVSQVAQMTGRYSTQMEEWQKKRELLSRVTREDVELYRKGKLALLDFNFAMAGLSTTVMRALSPAIQGGIKILHSLSDWVRRNEPNIIRFVTVLAGTITAVLIPSFVKLGAAMLTNPLTWIIAGILLLAIVIDDLVTYIRGGESEFGDFWAQFGTGEQILAWLSGTARSFIDVLRQYGPALAIVTAGLKAVTVAMKIMGVTALSNPVLAILAAIAFAAVYIIGNWSKITAFFQGIFNKISTAFSGFIKSIKDKLPDWLKKFLGIDGESMDATVNAKVQEAEAARNEAQPAHTPSPGPAGPSLSPAHATGQALMTAAATIPTASQLLAAGAASVTNNNTRETTIEATYNTTINAPSADPQAIAGAFGNQARQQNVQLSCLAAEGGVRQ